MKYYKIKFSDDINDFKYAKANTMLELIKKYDLASQKHINTRIIELSGEMAGIAQDFLNN